MRKIWNWIEDNAGPITVTIAILGGFAAIIQFSVVRPMQQGFDTVNQRIDDQIKYIDQRLDDQDRSINQRFDDQIKYINQRFDDQIKYINQRFDAVDQRFDDQDKYIDQRFDAVDQRFDAQDRRIEDLVKDVSELRKTQRPRHPQRNTNRHPHRAVADRRRTLAPGLSPGQALILSTTPS